MWTRNKAKGTKNMLKLITEYNAFKKNNIKHFRFNSTSSNSVYGKVLMHIFVYL